MSASIYTEKSVRPDEKMLANDLAGAKKHFDRLAQFIESEYGRFTCEWKFYGAQSGWIIKMFSGKRNVLFVIPLAKYFRVALTFGEKAVDGILDSDLPAEIKEKVSAAQKYAEGRTIQLDVKSKAALDTILKLVRIKLMN